MGLLDQFTQAVDARKRYYGNIVRGLLDNPQALMEQLQAQNAENVREQSRSVQDTRSVMPGIAEPAKQAAFDEAMNVGLLGLTAYHGSPHQFDKFDMSKIGTGEGAQAYGYGLYFAENPGTARFYAGTLARRADDPNYWAYGEGAKHPLPPSLGPPEVAELGKLSQKMRASGNLPAAEMQRWRELKDMDRAFSDAIDKYKPKPNLYKVDIPDEAVAKMLDWDKPLSQQPEALGKIRNLVPEDIRKSFDYNVARGIDGSNAYHSWVPGKTGEHKAQALRSAEIYGIRYLDGGSRGAGSGTSNFVVFDPEIIKILSRE